MKGMMVVLFGGLIFAAAACGSNGSQPSIEPLGGDDIATSLDGDSIATVDGPNNDTDPDCVIDCNGRECGSDGCGGTCGSCGTGMNCLDGQCAMGCDSANCGLGVGCVFAGRDGVGARLNCEKRRRAATPLGSAAAPAQRRDAKSRMIQNTQIP